MADQGASYGSREHLRRRGRGSADTSRSTDGMYRPGQPIGFLAARGTPYEKKYLTKKLGWCCTWLAPPIVLVTLALGLVPIIWAIANHTLHVAQLHVLEANITSITNTSFPLSLNAQVTKSGIFPATLYFRAPVDIYWRTVPTADAPEGNEVHLGQMKLGRVNAAAGHAKVLQTTEFQIIDGPAFDEFSKFLITQPEFTWYLHCPNVHAEAFGFFPAFKNYDFKKTTVVKGFDNFHDVKILNFQLPGDDPAGGISAQVLTSLTNPSPFAVQLGSLELDLYYKDLYLGPAAAAGFVNVTTGVNVVQLNARLIPHADNSTALDMLGDVFTGYINGDAVPVIAKGRSTTLANGQTIGWLAAGISALEVNVPLQSPEPINPIKGIDITYLSLAFDDANPWRPMAFSNALSGALGLPFGFSLNILSTSNSISLLYDNVTVANIDGAYSNATTTLELVSAGQTAGTLDITLPPTPLSLPGDESGNNQTAHDNFVAFSKALIFAPDARVRLQGSSRAVSDTPVGRVLLNGIKFDVGSGLTGLDSLTKYPTEITSVDVLGGTKEAVQLVVGTALVNPSNLNLSVGDAHFQLINEVPLGTVTLPNLNLKIGRNDINATSNFSPNVDPKGLETLNRFISGLNTNLNISGFDGSSTNPALNPAFLPVRLNATLPGLQQSLVQSAALNVLDTTGLVNNVADATVSIANPFTSDLTITRISSKVYSHGIFLADIDTPLNFVAKGKAISNQSAVPLGLNLYPPDIFGAVRAFAIDAGEDPAYIDGLVGLGGFTLTKAIPNTNAPTNATQKRSFVEANEGGAMADLLMGAGTAGMREAQDEQPAAEAGSVARLQKRGNIYTGFDITTYVAKAFKAARTDLEITADSVIGEYGTTLTFTQSNVPLQTDETLFKLLPVLAKPIVQKIVDGAILNVDRATVVNPSLNGFTAALQGSLKQAGPFDAIVEFTKGLNVHYKGQLLGQIAMPNVTLVGDVGSTLDLTAPFAIADTNFMQAFTTDALHAATFVWNVAAEGITAHALGIVVPNITISKDVILTGFNGLKGNVVVNAFDLPSNDPAGGLHLTVDATINNPAQVGVELSRFGTMITGNGTTLGPSAAANPFTLAALAQTRVPLVGRLQPQTDASALDVLGTIFTNFVHDKATTVSVAGQYAGPEEVTWLNNAIKTLSIDVILPSIKFQVIKSVSLNQLSLAFTEGTAWNPSTSTVNSTAPFFLPFAFPVAISSAQGQFIANYNGQDAAVLNVPNVPTKTDTANRILTLAFDNVPFNVYDNAHSAFSQFIADTTAKDQVTFGLHGSATAQATTAAGTVTISDIPFDVNSAILGLQNFNARPAVVSNLDVNHGYPDYIKITLDTALYNPSDITITAGNVNFDAKYTDHAIGQAIINGLQVVPGTNNIPTQLNYSPQGSANVAAGQTVLENYIQNITSNAVVAGTSGSTPIASLQQALAGVALSAAIPPLNKMLVTEAILEVPKNIDTSPVAQAQVVIANPFTAGISILKIKSSPMYNDLTVGSIDVDLSNGPVVAPGHKTSTSQIIPITLNTKPKALVQLVLELAQASGTDLGPWPPFFQELLSLPGDAPTQVRAYPDSSDTGCHLGNQFDLLGAVLNALKSLSAKIPIQSSVMIDEYATDLNFVQNPVPVKTDNTALYLLGPAGAPLIQVIVDTAGLAFTQANATRITDEGFQVALRGSLMTGAPANALIEFTKPVQIAWEGRNIAEITLPPICTIPGVGVPDLETTGQLRITDEGAFTDFAKYILANKQFTWTISSDALVVRALQITFSNVSINKQISLDVFNNLPGVAINKFTVTGEDTTALALKYQADASIPSPSALGVELGNANFKVYYSGTYLGPASAYDLFLAPQATTKVTLFGEIIKQNNAQDLANVGILFSRFLAGLNSTLDVTGDTVITPYQSTPIRWLSTAFQSLTLHVVLPGVIYQIIQSIAISDLTVRLLQAGDAYNVPSDNKQSIAKFANPFPFSLVPVEAGPDIIINFNGVNTAELKLPLAPVGQGTTGSSGPNDPGTLFLSWTNQRIKSLNDDSFGAFFAKLTDTPGTSFGVIGTTSVVANTIIGQLTVTGIPINVTSSLAGIDSFGGMTPVSNVVVQGSTPEYVSIPLVVSLQNPSHLTVITNEVYIPAQYQGVEIGRAYVKNLVLNPGKNDVAAEFRYAPADPANPTALQVLELYLEPANHGANGGSSPQNASLTIGGQPQTPQAESPYGSLIPALEGVKATSQLPGIGARLVTHIDVYIDLLVALATNMAQASLTVANTLPAGLTIDAVSSDVYVNGKEPVVRAQVVNQMPNLHIPGKSSATSGKLDVVLTDGVIGSLDVLGNPLSTKNVIRATVDGGYVIPALPYSLYDIPTGYTITALGGVINLNITGPADLLQALLQFAESQGQLGQLVGELEKVGTGILSQIGAGLAASNPLSQTACTGALGGLLGPILPVCKSLAASSSSSAAAAAAAKTVPLVPNVASVVNSLVGGGNKATATQAAAAATPASATASTA